MSKQKFWKEKLNVHVNIDCSTCEEEEGKEKNKQNNIIRCASINQFNHKMIECKRINV